MTPEMLRVILSAYATTLRIAIELVERDIPKELHTLAPSGNFLRPGEMVDAVPVLDPLYKFMRGLESDITALETK